MNSKPLRGMTRLLGRGLYWVAIVLILFFFLFPLYWLFASSIKSPGDVTVLPPRFVPFLQFQPTLDNYRHVLSTTAAGARLHTFPGALFNSFLISGTATVVAVILGTLAAYVFSRFPIKGENDWLFFILSTRMLPPVVVKGFFDEIPREYEDAAMVDGYSRLEAVWKIVIPEAIPAMLATAVFVLITAWNEFVFVTLLNPNAWSTVPPFLYQIIGYGRTEWARMAAASMIFILPIVIFTFLVRKHLLRGVTFGAVRR
jgi:multiple sugar transport system permease protein